MLMKILMAPDAAMSVRLGLRAMSLDAAERMAAE